MTDKKIIALLAILVLLCLVAVTGNGFITVALSVKWLLRRTLSPHNKLLISLAASRFCLQWVVIGKNIYVFVNPGSFPYSPVIQILNFMWDFLTAVTIWFCSWLGFFYCVKIATLTHPAFLWLKYKVPGWVPWMLLSAVGMSGLTSILCFIGNQIIYQNHLRSGRQPWNITGNSLRHSLETFYFFSIKVIMWTIPTVIFTIFMILLLISLIRHMKKTFLVLSGHQDIRVQAHIKAFLTLLSFIILFISCFLTLILSSASGTQFQELKYWIWQVVIHLCTVIHPLVLLFSNPRLRAMLKRGCC
uniref:Taste receptor type 2 n=2 Tax=Nannospalax galili TaxID=1026970 RepID=A0A7S5W7W3_NANGA|nr:taste receptor type 2 member 135 [Nannospalax galili]QKE46111.1 taste receptor type 2 member 135 [Nannospalax galili]QKE46113.1 taste receptor type 2 member 135 [Nannospalax galili]QKE46115.1 taste receptor type 2 member 135 [Nannospalax galili]QKE46116.1 taste receptor type 2 member 135 [Nannospalax galili]